MLSNGLAVSWVQKATFTQLLRHALQWFVLAASTYTMQLVSPGKPQHHDGELWSDNAKRDWESCGRGERHVSHQATTKCPVLVHLLFQGS